MFEKNLQVGELLDFYGDLFNERRRELLELYYNRDLSLGEIAAEFGISRQGVRDAIKKAEEELCFFEEKLKLFEKAEKMRAAGEKLLLQAKENPEIKEAAEALLNAAGLPL